MHYETIFQEIYRELQSVEDEGHVADYIPELAQVDPDQFGVFLVTIDGEKHPFGDAEKRFSIQSIAKVFSFVLAYSRVKSDIWERMDLEPAGTPFNSLVQLEYDKGIPRNPFVNAGAIVVCDILVSELTSPIDEILSFIHELTPHRSIQFNPRVAQSEKETGFRNYALVNLMKSFKNIHNDIDPVMDLYFQLCSIEMSCRELAEAFLFLANNGVVPYSGQRILSPSRTKRTNALMQTCGFYDEAGQFTFKVACRAKAAWAAVSWRCIPSATASQSGAPGSTRKGTRTRGCSSWRSSPRKRNSPFFKKPEQPS